MIRRYKFRIYPTPEQAERMEGWFRACRYVYNLALETRTYAYRSQGVTLNKFDLGKELPGMKKDAEWLRDVPAQALISELDNLDNAFKHFFRRVKQGGAPGYPRFKSKYDTQSFAVWQNVKIENGNLVYPKIGHIKLIQHRPIPGEIKTATIIKTKTNEWYVSMPIDDGIEPPEKVKVKTAVGVDLGIKKFVITSDGKEYDNLRLLDKNLKKLRVLQRKMSRQKKGSNRREQTRLQVAKLHEKIKRQREYYLHQISHELISKYDLVATEDLQVKNMVKNRSLAKAISQIGWGQFLTMLDYKANRSGKHLVKVDKFFPSSKTCSACGFVLESLSLNQRDWDCPDCGTHHDRDLNAALNIKKEGLIRSPAVANVEGYFERRPQKTLSNKQLQMF
jgi:putative transposase